MSSPVDQQINTDSSIQTFISSLIFNTGITVAVFIAFDFVRKRNRKVYEPRTYLVPEKKRSEPLPTGFFKWVLPVLRVPDEEVIKRIGLDAFMFIRFMGLFMKLFGIFSVLGIVILLPLDSKNQKGGSGLDQFTLGNISDSNRLWAHLILSYFFSCVTIYVLYHELRTFIRLRHEYLTTDEHRNSPRATTILVVGIPNEMNNSKALKALFDIFPGGVKRIWLNREPSKLEGFMADREKLVNKLEGSATTYITQHAKNLAKSPSKESNAENGSSAPSTTRPQHRKLLIMGKKVDSLETYRSDLSNLNQQILNLQKNPNDFKQLNSAFIQFNNYIGAQLAAASTVPRLTDIAPDDIIWENLNLKNNQRIIRRFISLAIVIALVLLWIFPVTFVASISQLESLQKLPLLKNIIGSFPKEVFGIIQGILPALGLAILMFILPIILKFLSKFEGIVTYSSVDLSLQGKYYFFLVVNVLLISTFANGIFTALPNLIEKPTQAIDILAVNLPLASTFFLTYVLLTISASAIEIFQIAPLISDIIFRKFLAKTPRKIWQLERAMLYKDWGTAFPPHTLIACIGLVYSTVQPLILPIVTLHFMIYYLVYRYQFLYVYEQPNQTGGLLFPKGVYQMFTGIYIFQLTLTGLMFLKGAFVQGILCIILLMASVIVLVSMRKIFKHNPRAEFLPVDLTGIIDMKSRKVLVGNDHGKHKHEQEVVEKDEYARQDVLHINEGDEEELQKEEGSKTFMHPAITSAQPIVWLPDDQNISDDFINEFRKSGINATNQGATLNEKSKVVIDKNKIPLDIQDDKYAKQLMQEKAQEKNHGGPIQNVAGTSHTH
ncbi:15380_t:CDS:2 [Funneliformis mosseae]|uniref:15380_t:CDS:1 n=1 Tax=Funneliformis mosseae TaxID=27381 RepID=A0A9N9AU74_FUNMO|nr:15380_t:CDS:2 [Funneliformis mosseae]